MSGVFPRPSQAMVVLAASLGGVGLGAGVARADTLADAIAYAYQNNPGLQAQRATLRSINENYVQARAGFGPSVALSVNGSNYDDRITAGLEGRVLQHNQATTGNGQVIVNQTLYAGGRLHAQLSQAEAQILGARETLRRYEMDLLVQVVTAYMSVRRDEQLLKVNQDTVAVLQKEVSDTQARNDPKVRTVTMTDVAQAKARLASAQSSLAAAQAALGISRAQYISIVGQAPGTLEAPPALTGLPTDISQAFESAEANNPQLLAAQYTEQRSRARVAEAKASRLPQVSAQVAWSRSPYIPYSATTYNSVTSATVTASVPLFTSGQLQSQARQAQEQNNSDQLLISETRNQVTLAVATAWEQLSGIRNQLKTLEDAVAAQTFAFYGNREEEKLALRTTIDVLNAELELTNAQQSMIRSRADEYAGEVRVLSAIGVLDVALLSPGARAFDPSVDFKAVQHKGETPLEWPVRALDGIGGMKVGPPRPASTADLRPGRSSAMPPAPDPEKPLPSILSTIDSLPAPPN